MPRGGKREGAGRKSGKVKEPQTIYITPAQKEWLQKKGRISVVVGKLIDEAINAENSEK